MPDRNNYVVNDLGILYRLCVHIGYMYAYNCSAQSVDSSEKTMVMLYMQIVSYL